MKKRTLVAMLRDEARKRCEIKSENLILAVGGIPTITQDENGKVVVVGGDTAPV